MIKWANLEVRYGSLSALKNVSGMSRPGLTVILGSNGSGKSTLLRSLAGHIQPCAGSIKIGHKCVVDSGPQERFCHGVCYLPQNSVTIPDVTPTTYQSIMSSEASLKNLWILLNENIRSEWDKTIFVHSLSLATRRVMDLAFLFSSQPCVALLDEPIAGLGDDGIDDAIKLLQHAKSTTQLIIVEHRRSFLLWAAQFDAYSYFFHNGEVAVEGYLQDLIQNEFVQKVYGKIV